eukprot:jgi/Tetstr1/458026/TSEL_044535.t1
MERPSFAVDEVGGLALTYGNAQSEGNAFPRMLAVAGAALDIDMDTPHTYEAYTDKDDNGATPHGNAGARHPNRAGNEKRDRDQALRRLSRDQHARAGETGVARCYCPAAPAAQPAPTGSSGTVAVMGERRGYRESHTTVTLLLNDAVRAAGHPIDGACRSDTERRLAA